jgi:hypothetical protein
MSPTRNTFYHVPAVYHKPTTTMAFADSHVEIHKWRNPQTYNPPSNLDWHGHNWTVGANQDLQWLKQRTSIKK